MGGLRRGARPISPSLARRPVASWGLGASAEVAFSGFVNTSRQAHGSTFDNRRVEEHGRKTKRRGSRRASAFRVGTARVFFWAEAAPRGAIFACKAGHSSLGRAPDPDSPRPPLARSAAARCLTRGERHEHGSFFARFLHYWFRRDSRTLAKSNRSGTRGGGSDVLSVL